MNSDSVKEVSITDRKAESRGGKPLAAILSIIWFFTACGSKTEVNPRLADAMPRNIVWAWERPENLRFLDPNEYGVAFLAQTIYLDAERIVPNRRRQPLEIVPGAYVIAVTRIETNKEMARRATMSDEMMTRTSDLIMATLDLPDVRGIQIDFDAVSSERVFYSRLIHHLRTKLPAGKSLTMTALASWCAGDTWLNSFPVDEVVPMVFEMGADAEKVKNFLRNGTDWQEPLCRGSYGISVDDPVGAPLRPGRRIYLFSNASWKRADIERARELTR